MDRHREVISGQSLITGHLIEGRLGEFGQPPRQIGDSAPLRRSPTFEPAATFVFSFSQDKPPARSVVQF